MNSDQTKDSVFSAIIYLFRFFFVAFLVLGFLLAGKNPVLVKILAIALLIAGPLSFIYGLHIMRKYKTVHDYESTELLGRKCTGKQVRTLSQGLGSSGVMLLVAGVILYFLSSIAKS